MSKRLLLADDSITIQKVVNLTFADEGIEVVSVGDGDAAMLKFNESMPDLVLADVNMPGLDGYRMCEMIKQDEETKHIPVILLVGSFEPFDEQEAFRVGADDFLTKPFQSIRQLVTKVSDLLNGPAKSDVSKLDSDIPAMPETNNDWQYADTKEFPVELADSEDLGDTGMDDEMIQTNQVGGGGGEPAAFDEVQNFISQSYAYRDDEGQDKSEQENLTEESFKNESDEDFALLEPTTENESERNADENIYENRESFDSKIYNLSDYENKKEGEEISDAVKTDEENSAAEQSETPEENTIYAEEITESATVSDWEFAVAEAEEDQAEIVKADQAEILETAEADDSEIPADYKSLESEKLESETAAETADEIETAEDYGETEIEQAFAPPQTATMVTFDDFNLLELPPLVEETGIRPQPEKQEVRSLAEDSAPENGNEETAQSVAADSNAQEISVQAFPPELIEAIAQKVAERISDKTIRDIAWEVVPQMTDLIVQRLAEEQLNKKAKETSK